MPEIQRKRDKKLLEKASIKDIITNIFEVLEDNEFLQTTREVGEQFIQEESMKESGRELNEEELDAAYQTKYQGRGDPHRTNAVTFSVSMAVSCFEGRRLQMAQIEIPQLINLDKKKVCDNVYVDIVEQNNKKAYFKLSIEFEKSRDGRTSYNKTKLKELFRESGIKVTKYEAKSSSTNTQEYLKVYEMKKTPFNQFRSQVIQFLQPIDIKAIETLIRCILDTYTGYDKGDMTYPLSNARNILIRVVAKMNSDVTKDILNEHRNKFLQKYRNNVELSSNEEDHFQMSMNNLYIRVSLSTIVEAAITAKLEDVLVNPKFTTLSFGFYLAQEKSKNLPVFDFMQLPIKQLYLFLNVAIYSARRLLILLEEIDSERDKRSLILGGQTSAGKTTVLDSLHRIFKGKRLQSLNARDDFFDRDIFCGGFLTKDDIQSDIALLANGEQKVLTDAKAVKVLKVKFKEAVHGGRGMPLIVATNYKLPDIIQELYSKPSVLWDQNVAPLLNRFTIIQSEETENQPNHMIARFAGKLTGELDGYSQNVVYDWTFCQYILFFAEQLQTNLYRKEKDRTSLFKESKDLLKTTKLGQLLLDQKDFVAQLLKDYRAKYETFEYLGMLQCMVNYKTEDVTDQQKLQELFTSLSNVAKAPAPFYTDRNETCKTRLARNSRIPAESFKRLEQLQSEQMENNEQIVVFNRQDSDSDSDSDSDQDPVLVSDAESDSNN